MTKGSDHYFLICTVTRVHHQQTGVKLLAIIGFTPYYWQLLAIIAIIGYYWLLFFLQKFLYYWLLLRQAPSLIIAIIGILLLQLLVPLPIICIIGNYWQLLILIQLLVLILINFLTTN
jgi:hypothetical protein